MTRPSSQSDRCLSLHKCALLLLAVVAVPAVATATNSPARVRAISRPRRAGVSCRARHGHGREQAARTQQPNPLAAIPHPDAHGGGDGPLSAGGATRLYYLKNSYRGLMVFDVSRRRYARLLGRSPIFGDPIEMIVRTGWRAWWCPTGTSRPRTGEPFHGSIVRGIDATDPATCGSSARRAWADGFATHAWWETCSTRSPSSTRGTTAGTRAPLASSSGGVGVAVAVGRGAPARTVAVTVSISQAASSVEWMATSPGPGRYLQRDGRAHSCWAPTSSAPMTGPATARLPVATEAPYPRYHDPGASSPSGVRPTSVARNPGLGRRQRALEPRFADGQTAHVIACSGDYCGSGGGLVLSTVDFTNPDTPKFSPPSISPPPPGARRRGFDTGRMYLSPARRTAIPPPAGR